MIEYVFIFSGLLVVLRTILGPTFADRVMCVDIFTSLVVLGMAYYSVMIGNELYMDVAILFALISFVGVLAIAKWTKK